MALQKISQLNSITGAQITASSDVLAVVNNNETKKITVSGLHSGSFSGSFQGDGSGITGVTGEWDGSHNGNASITGSLTVTSDVSSSGNVYGENGTFSNSISTPKWKVGSAEILATAGDLTINASVTASSDISSSATSTASFGTYLGDGSQLTGVTSEWDGTLNGDAEITGSLILSGSNIYLNVLGNITASGDISSSGYLIASEWHSTDDIVSSGNRISMGTDNIIDLSPSNTTVVRLSDTLVTLNKDTKVVGHITASKNVDIGGELIQTGFVSTSDSSPNITGISVWKITLSGASVITNLGNGTPGQRLTIYCDDDSLTGADDVQPLTTPSNYTSISFAAEGDSADLIYDGNIGWVIIGSYGAIIS